MKMIKEIPELKIIAECFNSLKEQKIIRSNNLVGDIGEHYCEQNFGVILSENKVQKGYDGIDENGKKVQIKSRKTPLGTAVVYFKNLDFDYCLYLELNEIYQPIEILKISKEEIYNNLCKKRQRLSVSKIKQTKNISLIIKTPTSI